MLLALELGQQRIGVGLVFLSHLLHRDEGIDHLNLGIRRELAQLSLGQRIVCAQNLICLHRSIF